MTGHQADCTVAVTGLGTYVPERVVTGAEVASRSGVPEDVVVEKMGLSRKHVCPPDGDHCSDMATAAGRRALADAGVAPESLDLVVYHGSEYKDYIVWSAAADVAERLGASNAYATESYTLCAGAPVAIRQVRTQLLAGDVDRALLVAASREADLVDYTDEDASFTFNFGNGASAYVLERMSEGAEDDIERVRATVRESAALTDGSFSRDVVMPAGGSRRPPSDATVEAGEHSLTVPDHETMKERLGETSLPSFLSVADDALARSGYDREDVDYCALVHMKRSFHDRVLVELGLTPTESYYLDDYGHVQSVDQALSLQEGVDRGRIQPGDVVLLLAAGTGYTWAATVLEWDGQGW